MLFSYSETAYTTSRKWDNCFYPLEWVVQELVSQYESRTATQTERWQLQCMKFIKIHIKWEMTTLWLFHKMSVPCPESFFVFFQCLQSVGDYVFSFIICILSWLLGNNSGVVSHSFGIQNGPSLRLTITIENIHLCKYVQVI